MKKITLFVLLQFLLPLIHAELEAQDIPTTTVETLTGNYRQIQSGISFYPDLTSNTFTVNLPSCSGGATPTIAYAYLSWQGRFRDQTNQIPAGGPNFDQNLNVQLNSSSVTDIAATFFPVGSAEQVPTTRWHFTGFADVTAFVQANITTGANTVQIMDFDRPNQQGGANYNQNFGVGLTIVYECPTFPLSTITVGAGADFFFCGTPADEVGDYSEVTLFEFPAATSDLDALLKGTFGGQANVNAPFRGGNICYVVGSGTPPVATRTNDLPDPVVINDPNVICTTNPTWVSSLGQEWDSLNVSITIPAGATYLAIQGQSIDGMAPTGTNCGSLITSTFSLEVPGNLFCLNPVATAQSTEGTCNNSTPNDNATIALSSVTNATEAGIVAGTDYDVASGPAFGDAANLDVSSGSATFMNLMHSTDYVIRVFNGANDCFTDYPVTTPAIACCSIDVTVAEPSTICSTQAIDLTVDATITPASLGGTWSTPDGSDSAFSPSTDYATATTYQPTPDDIRRGSVTLVLTTNDPAGICDAESASVTIHILNVDCGSFFWNGSN